MVRVDIEGLWKRFPDGTTVGPINLTVDHGEMVSLLGPSGSGKTTTLRMVAGFIEPDKGRLCFDGKDVGRVPPNEREIGMVLQSVALFPNMNVFQNIAFALDVRGWPRDRIIERVEELSEILGITKLLSRRTDQISGGEGQRVALARALAHEPELLLLDEPLSALDPKLRETLQAEIREIQQKLRVSSIYVTHNQEEAFAISDRIAVLENGTISQVGEPDELYHYPQNEFVASFIGRGSILRGTVQQKKRDMIRVAVGSGAIWLQGSEDVGRSIAVSVKPEDITITDSPDGTLRARLESIVKQPGRYRIELRIEDQELYTYVSSLTNIAETPLGDFVNIALNPDEVSILE
jgi:ABC-type Fe3+/spermidine/putrescine transport system ATPase subunit